MSIMCLLSHANLKSMLKRNNLFAQKKYEVDI